MSLRMRLHLLLNISLRKKTRPEVESIRSSIFSSIDWTKGFDQNPFLIYFKGSNLIDYKQNFKKEKVQKYKTCL